MNKLKSGRGEFGIDIAEAKRGNPHKRKSSRFGKTESHRFDRRSARQEIVSVLEQEEADVERARRMDEEEYAQWELDMEYQMDQNYDDLNEEEPPLGSFDSDNDSFYCDCPDCRNGVAKFWCFFRKKSFKEN